MDLLSELIKLVGVPAAVVFFVLYWVLPTLHKMQEKELTEAEEKADTNKALTQVFTASQLANLKREDLLIAAKDELIRAYQKVSEYELKFKDIENQVKELDRKVNNRDKRIKDLEEQVAELQDLLTGFKKTLQAREAERIGLIKERAQLMDYVSRLEAQILVLRTRLEKLDTQTLKALSVEVEAIKDTTNA
jgi:predicted  nucleic acid-binding Zn-ribbon protein